MVMTVNKAYKILAELIAQGHGKKPLCINKSSFSHPLEDDGCTILGVEEIDGPLFIPNCDGDGFTEYNKDGTESGRYTVVLFGDKE